MDVHRWFQPEHKKKLNVFTFSRHFNSSRHQILAHPRRNSIGQRHMWGTPFFQAPFLVSKWVFVDEITVHSTYSHLFYTHINTQYELNFNYYLISTVFNRNIVEFLIKFTDYHTCECALKRKLVTWLPSDVPYYCNLIEEWPVILPKNFGSCFITAHCQ